MGALICRVKRCDGLIVKTWFGRGRGLSGWLEFQGAAYEGPIRLVLKASTP